MARPADDKPDDSDREPDDQRWKGVRRLVQPMDGAGITVSRRHATREPVNIIVKARKTALGARIAEDEAERSRRSPHFTLRPAGRPPRSHEPRAPNRLALAPVCNAQHLDRV